MWNVINSMVLVVVIFVETIGVGGGGDRDSPRAYDK